MSLGARVDAVDDYGCTSLHAAVMSGQRTTMRLLLEAGADPCHESYLGHTALYEAALAGREDLVRVLLRVGGKLSSSDVIGLAVKGRWPELLSAAGVSRDTRDCGGWSPLHWAVNKGRVETVHCLIRRGLDIESTTECGWTPLHLAAVNGDLPMAQLLVRLGAKINPRDNADRTPLNLALQEGKGALAVFLKSKGGLP